jgi:hypothetical protein
MGHEDGFDTNRTKRGNATRVRQWRSDKSAWLEAQNLFDVLGNVVETADPRGSKTLVDYTDVFSGGTVPPLGSTFGFATKITMPEPRDGFTCRRSCKTDPLAISRN